MYKLFGIFLLVVIAGGFFLLPKIHIENSPPKALKNMSFPSSDVIESQQIAKPTKFSIPKIEINTAIEAVGMDARGRMDVPQNVNNVAWYKLGYKPGDEGSAVISGHYDQSTGAPAVFYNLSKLNTGDEINVEDEAGNKRTFIVFDKKQFPYESLPLRDIFATAGSPTLNLITCAGNWDTNNKNYSMRTVIYSRLQKK